ncbi:hypothetical protein NKCBBBOE_00579 [Pseudarthrobacter sp. MM222]|nr:hypothetical protein NKCBBBOE_00579 [Pseudarthrobacter sp. MM222]
MRTSLERILGLRLGTNVPSGLPFDTSAARDDRVPCGSRSRTLALTANSDPLLSAIVARGNGALGPLKLPLNENSYSWQFLPIPGMTFTNVGTTGSFSGTDTCQ